MHFVSSVLKEQNMGRTLDLESKLKAHLCHFSSFELHLPYLPHKKDPNKRVKLYYATSCNTST